jgi:hypothetical protein
MGEHKKTTDLIASCAAILREVQPTTVRGTAYQLFVRGRQIPSMESTHVRMVQRILGIAREDGRISWEHIVDESRGVESTATWRDPIAFAEQMQRRYRKDVWQDQPVRLRVISEKATVAGILRPVLDAYAVDFQVFHGWGSKTAVHDLAEFSADGDERPLILLYVGDHDPSGRYMSDVDVPTRLKRYGGGAELVRLAVTPEQIAAHHLPPFEAEEKKQDPRYTWFLENHGTACFELDALDPNLLRRLVTEAIRSHTDVPKWERSHAAEVVELASVSQLAFLMEALMEKRAAS